MLSAAPLPATKEFTNSLGMRFTRIEAGAFTMGETQEMPPALLDPLTYPTRSELTGRFPEIDPAKFRLPTEAAAHGDYDERPVHRAALSQAYYLGTCEVTNAQFEQFLPAHRALRGKHGFSQADDEAVVFVTWAQAVAFCEWLSQKEQRPYRLPTETEWEYAARAGTTTLFSTGNTLPAPFLKNARSTAFTDPQDSVSLAVGMTPPNPWGLFDMHGNVEDWVADWYGLYQSGDQVDPSGPTDGDFRVTRGGSHGVDPYYLRSANRLGALPETASWLIGFRVALGPPVAHPGSQPAPPAVGSRPAMPPTPPRFSPAADASAPYFAGPRCYVKIPAGSNGPLFSQHNHDAAITDCPNGDLLAIWYTCVQERGREVAIAAARLRRGADEWEPAYSFWDTPDHNDHCPALWYDGMDTMYHCTRPASARAPNSVRRQERAASAHHNLAPVPQGAGASLGCHTSMTPRTSGQLLPINNQPLRRYAAHSALGFAAGWHPHVASNAVRIQRQFRMNVYQHFKSMMSSIPRLAPAECIERLHAGTGLLVDVREPHEWVTDVAAGSSLLPLSDLNGPRNLWRPFLATVGQREIVLYCTSGARSAAAGRLLLQEGFHAVDAGAIEDWADAGWPITHESLAPNHRAGAGTAAPFSSLSTE